MAKHKIPKEKQAKLMVATEEIFSNIAQYAYKSHGLARIYTYINNGTYHICFNDNGIDYNPQKRDDPDLTGSAEQRNIGGLGVYLVKELTDEVSYKRDNGRNILDICVKI